MPRVTAVEAAHERCRRVGDVELAPAIELPADASLHEAAAVMADACVSAVLLVGETGVRHILTERDVTRAVAATRRVGTPARAAATPHPIAVIAESPVLDALALMVTSRVRDLPVVDRNGDVVGILTMAAALEALLESPDPPSWLTALSVALRVETAGAGR